MDYEKIHKKTVEIARQLVNEGKIIREYAEQMCPELREYENERIINQIKKVLHDCGNGIIPVNIDFADCFTWLENQGDENKEYWNGYRDGKQEVLDKYAIKKQGEQKPAWSEEDETTKNNISHIIRQYDKISKRDNQPCCYVGDCLLWMQNIRDRVQPQPKQEWSEEDERFLCKCLGALGNPNYCYEDGELECMRNWLKSLRPKSQWKPSEDIPYWKKSTLPNDSVTGFNSDFFSYNGYCINYKELFDKLPKED